MGLSRFEQSRLRQTLEHQGMTRQMVRLQETQQATLRTLLRTVHRGSRTPAEALAELVKAADFEKGERVALLKWCGVTTDDANKR